MGLEDVSSTIRRLFLTVRRTWPDFWGLFGMVWGAADIPTVWAGDRRHPAHMWQGISVNHTLIWNVEILSTEEFRSLCDWLSGAWFFRWNWSLMARLLRLKLSQMWDWTIEDEKSMNLIGRPKRLPHAALIFFKGYWFEFEVYWPDYLTPYDMVDVKDVWMEIDAMGDVNAVVMGFDAMGDVKAIVMGLTQWAMWSFNFENWKTPKLIDEILRRTAELFEDLRLWLNCFGLMLKRLVGWNRASHGWTLWNVEKKYLGRWFYWNRLKVMALIVVAFPERCSGSLGDDGVIVVEIHADAQSMIIVSRHGCRMY